MVVQSSTYRTPRTERDENYMNGRAKKKESAYPTLRRVTTLQKVPDINLE